MNKMLRHSHQLATIVSLLLLQFVLRVAVASDDAVVYYGFPALDDRAADGLVVTTTSSILSPATFLFDAQLFPEFNRTEGFVLLSRPVQLWGAAESSDDTNTQTQQVADGAVREASFNTSFTVRGGATPVAFVVLLDSFPPLAGSTTTNGSGAAALNASDGLAFVEVGAVGSYGPESPDVGLNVTVTPNGTAAASRGRAVWIQYDAVAHRICVHVTAAGEPRPLKGKAALLDAPLNLASRRTTQNAFVGFFASTVRDVIHGVRDWELTVDRFPGADGDRQNGSVSISSWLLILLAVLGSVGAMIGVASVVVCYCLSRRRQELKMEHIMKQVYPPPTRSRMGFVSK